MKDKFQSMLLPINILLTTGYLFLLARLWICSHRSESHSGQRFSIEDISNPRITALLQKLRSFQSWLKNRPFLAILDLKDPVHRTILTGLLPGFLLNGAVLLYFGQAMLPVPPETEKWIGWLYIACGFLIFLAGSFGFSRMRFPAVVVRVYDGISSWVGVTPLQLQLLASAPFLSFAASRLSGFQPLMHRPWHAASAWISAISFIILGSLKFPLKLSRIKIPRLEIAAVLTVSLIAALLRLSLLDSIPWLLTGDEGSAGLTANRFITGEQNNIFTTGWFAFPSLFYYLQSIPIRILGNTTTALRMSSALIGTLAVPLTYWAALPAFGRQPASKRWPALNHWAALFAAAYLAGFHFHIHFSRIGLNNIWDSFFFILAFGAALRFDRNQQAFHAALMGTAVGLCQYFYSSSRVLIILAGAWLLLSAVLRPSERGLKTRTDQRFTAGVILTILAFTAVSLPLASFYWQFPSDFLAPFQRVTVLNTEGPLLSWNVLIEKLPELKDQLTISLKVFTATNLRMWYNSSKPMLLTLPAALFFLGLGIMLLNLRNPAVIWLFLWLLSAIGISMFSKDAPAPQRLPYTAPGVSIVIAFSLHQASVWLANLWPHRHRWITAAAGLLVASSMGVNIYYYFHDHAASRDFGDLNTEVAFRAGKILREKPDETLVYFLGGRMGYFSHSSLQYLAPDCTGEDLFDPVTEPPPIQQFQETVFIILPERQEEADTLVEFFPQGESMLHYGNNEDVLFITYTVPPSY